jgi:hypothetical protein
MNHENVIPTMSERAGWRSAVALGQTEWSLVTWVDIRRAQQRRAALAAATLAADLDDEYSHGGVGTLDSGCGS